MATPPSISIVTPSYNRRRYLGDTIRSVLATGYPALEYAVVDGQSSDGSAELIAGHASRLAWWVSEPDGGQYDAINKGFARTSGEIMGWLNSDDLYLPWTLTVVGEVFAGLPQVEWITTAFPLIWDGRGLPIACNYRPGYSRRGFLRGEYLPTAGGYTTGYIQQESTFWRRTLWDRCGGRLDTSYRVAADFDLWMRFSAEAELYAVDVPLAGYRAHGDQRTANESEGYAREALASLRQHGGRPYAGIESFVMQSVVSHLPATARRWGNRVGLLSRRMACVHNGPGSPWQVIER